ncbi:hypothetical protein [Pedobacter cryoconitis]|uniref:hypothetical protein n=1 Tax=Pedobacter cryoconitis TaxID=188932 RepID=UPI0016074134|nr:hypothetical protein [Pedobacter cryoconitis]MBB5644898.1 hypothetical protein [Pedobacter cryoconitis]
MKLTRETKIKLQNETIANISVYVNLIESVRKSIKMIDNIDQIYNEKKIDIPNENLHLRRISEYTMLLGLIWLDITTAFRIYLNARENYEVLYAGKQLVITINEGFKKIYNYTSVDANGNLKTSERNKSFWIKDISFLVNKELSHLRQKYNEITNELNDYDDQELMDLKDPRDLFVHYHKENPSVVYDELIKLDIEKISLKIIPFMEILTKMISFGNSILSEYKTIILKKNDSFFVEHHQKMEFMKVAYANNPKAVELFNFIQNDLLNFNK